MRGGKEKEGEKGRGSLSFALGRKRSRRLCNNSNTADGV